MVEMLKNLTTREYGRAKLQISLQSDPLLTGMSAESQVWMSHGDTITETPEKCD